MIHSENLLYVVLIVSILLQPLTGISKDKNKPKLLPVSRWREVRRVTLDSVEVPFRDTMFISFKAKGAFSYHNKEGFIYNGTYTLTDKDLDFGTARFILVSKKPMTMVLANTNGVFHFIKDTSDTLKQIVMPKEEKIDSVTSIDQMIGHWSVYKRTTEKNLGKVDTKTQIKTILITGMSSDGKSGVLFSDDDKNDEPSWYIKGLNPDHTLQCEGRTSRSIKVIKCQKGELILEEDGLRYFFKQFK